MSAGRCRERRAAAGVAIAFGLIDVWEETAWVGFLQTRLERRRGFLAAAALTALPFAAIHLPLQVINGVTAPLDLAIAFALIATLSVAFRPLLGLALRGTGDSLLATGLLHTAFNQANNPEGIAAVFLDGANRQSAALLATVLLTVILCLVLRRRLGRAERLDDGTTSSVQYFERARFEYHPENAAPYDVLLGQFGRRLLVGR